MARTIQAGDFLPDLVFRDASDQLHSAGLAGVRWILLIFDDLDSALATLPAIQSALTRHRVPVVVAAFGSNSSSASLAADRTFFIGNELRALMLGDDSPPDGLSSCLVIERNLKISARIDNLQEQGALEEISQMLDRVGARTGTGATPVPVLCIPAALPREFCAEVIGYFQESADKVQGRSGLSSANLDMTVKRAIHVNIDNAFAEDIDSYFIYSLLPAVERVFDYRVTHRQAYKVSCYDAAQSGYFVGHRDNSDPGSLFRRFALSVVLSDGWEGDGICFPEYSDEPVDLAVGDAVVFPVSLLHRVGPITSGRRFVLLSFLYDQPAAQLRRSMLANPELLDGIYNDRISDDALSGYADFAPVSRFSPQYDLSQSAAMLAKIGWSFD